MLFLPQVPFDLPIFGAVPRCQMHLNVSQPWQVPSISKDGSQGRYTTRVIEYCDL